MSNQTTYSESYAWADPDGGDAYDSADGKQFIALLKSAFSDEQIAAFNDARIFKEPDGTYHVWFEEGLPDGVLTLTMYVVATGWFVRRAKNERRRGNRQEAVNAHIMFVKSDGLERVTADDIRRITADSTKSADLASGERHSTSLSGRLLVFQTNEAAKNEDDILETT